MNRRGFLSSILALGAAPAIVRADSLMRVVPRETLILGPVLFEPVGEVSGISIYNKYLYRQPDSFYDEPQWTGYDLAAPGSRDMPLMLNRLPMHDEIVRRWTEAFDKAFIAAYLGGRAAVNLR